MDETVGVVLARYGLTAVSEPEVIGVGTGNFNQRVETNAGARFLRKHFHGRPRGRTEQEHAYVTWAAERGILAPIPERTTSGETVVEHDGSLWALFPWARGETAPRGSLSERQVWAAGEMNGRIHRVMQQYPESIEARPPPAFNVEWAVTQLGRIIAAAAEQSADDWIIEGLNLQLGLLRTHGTNADETGLTRGPAHGDYHDQQLLFEADRLTAVTDWEMFGMRPRLWEVVRSLYFSEIMEGPHMESYLAGYREHMALPESECRLAMELWWQSRIHTAWVFQAYYLEGNTRVAEFFPETFRALRALADPDARHDLTERFVRAATR